VQTSFSLVIVYLLAECFHRRRTQRQNPRERNRRCNQNTLARKFHLLLKKSP